MREPSTESEKEGPAGGKGKERKHTDVPSIEKARELAEKVLEGQLGSGLPEFRSFMRRKKKKKRMKQQLIILHYR